jgi:MFS superfamily sulfate permease-like transporter
MKHKTGIILLLIGGALMVIGRAVGTIGVFEFIHTWLIANVTSEWVLVANGAMNVIRFIADIGGWAIIAGAIFTLLGLMRIGKFIIWVGLTFGLIALIIWVLTQIINFTGLSFGSSLDTIINQLYNQFTYNSGINFIGVSVAIIGKVSIKKVKKPKQSKIQATEVQDSMTMKTKFCPECGAEIPSNSNLCPQCGETIE